MSFVADNNRFSVIISNNILKEFELDLDFFISIDELDRLKTAIDKTIKFYKTHNIDTKYIRKNDKSQMKIFNERKYQVSEVSRLVREGIQKAKISDSLYLIGNQESDVVKIGRSINPKKRLMKLQTGMHFKLELLFSIPNKGFLEPEIHEIFKIFRLSGEWFKYDKSIIDYFKSLQK